ncbi:hypothetical protein ACFFX0_30410 [Citricoccus parietis]|uniref:Uncharacterized protein n=1 Tax=Citricoccus parietis TaxID=592307 RepID=A0ABV5G8H4_9MICC
MPDHRALHHFMGHYSGHVSDSSLLSAHPYFRLGPETPAQPRWWKTWPWKWRELGKDKRNSG